MTAATGAILSEAVQRALVDACGSRGLAGLG
jgi:hypothetical protein